MQEVLQQDSWIAGAQCLLQICSSAPSGYLFSNDVVQAVMGSLMAFLSQKHPEGSLGDQLVGILLEAGMKLVGKAQGPMAMAVLAKLALKAESIVEQQTEGMRPAFVIKIIYRILGKGKEKEGKNQDCSAKLLENCTDTDFCLPPGWKKGSRSYQILHFRFMSDLAIERHDSGLAA